MKIEEVKRNLNKKIRYKSCRHSIDGVYQLNACIIRKGKEGFYYQVELQDLKTNCILYADLEDIKVIT